MPSIKILNETFISLGKNKYGYEIGTVEIDLGRGNTVHAMASTCSTGGLSVAGFVGRYVTSTKPWKAHVSGMGDKLSVWFGRDDRSGRFNKANAIRWEPALYATLSNSEFWLPVAA
jgi:hypothetical protein